MELKSIMDQIAYFEAEALILADKATQYRTAAWEDWQKAYPDATTKERFTVWLDVGPKLKISRLPIITSKDGVDLFEDGEAPLWCQRHRTFSIETIGWELLTALESLEEFDERFTKQDIYDWMEELIRLNLGSVVFDW